MEKDTLLSKVRRLLSVLSQHNSLTFTHPLTLEELDCKIIDLESYHFLMRILEAANKFVSDNLSDADILCIKNLISERTRAHDYLLLRTHASPAANPTTLANHFCFWFLETCHPIPDFPTQEEAQSVDEETYVKQRLEPLMAILLCLFPNLDRNNSLDLLDEQLKSEHKQLQAANHESYADSIAVLMRRRPYPIHCGLFMDIDHEQILMPSAAVVVDMVLPQQAPTWQYFASMVILGCDVKSEMPRIRQHSRLDDLVQKTVALQAAERALSSEENVAVPRSMRFFFNQLIEGLDLARTNGEANHDNEYESNGEETPGIAQFNEALSLLKAQNERLYKRLMSCSEFCAQWTVLRPGVDQAAAGHAMNCNESIYKALVTFRKRIDQTADLKAVFDCTLDIPENNLLSHVSSEPVQPRQVRETALSSAREQYQEAKDMLLAHREQVCGNKSIDCAFQQQPKSCANSMFGSRATVLLLESLYGDLSGNFGNSHRNLLEIYRHALSIETLPISDFMRLVKTYVSLLESGKRVLNSDTDWSQEPLKTFADRKYDRISEIYDVLSLYPKCWVLLSEGLLNKFHQHLLSLAGYTLENPGPIFPGRCDDADMHWYDLLWLAPDPDPQASKSLVDYVVRQRGTNPRFGAFGCEIGSLSELFCISRAFGKDDAIKIFKQYAGNLYRWPTHAPKSQYNENTGEFECQAFPESLQLPVVTLNELRLILKHCSSETVLNDQHVDHALLKHIFNLANFEDPKTFLNDEYRFYYPDETFGMMTEQERTCFIQLFLESGKTGKKIKDFMRFFVLRGEAIGNLCRLFPDTLRTQILVLDSLSVECQLYWKRRIGAIQQVSQLFNQGFPNNHYYFTLNERIELGDLLARVKTWTPEFIAHVVPYMSLDMLSGQLAVYQLEMRLLPELIQAIAQNSKLSVENKTEKVRALLAARPLLKPIRAIVQNSELDTEAKTEIEALLRKCPEGVRLVFAHEFGLMSDDRRGGEFAYLVTLLKQSDAMKPIHDMIIDETDLISVLQSHLNTVLKLFNLAQALHWDAATLKCFLAKHYEVQTLRAMLSNEDRADTEARYFEYYNIYIEVLFDKMKSQDHSVSGALDAIYSYVNSPNLEKLLPAAAVMSNQVLDPLLRDVDRVFGKSIARPFDFKDDATVIGQLGALEGEAHKIALCKMVAINRIKEYKVTRLKEKRNRLWIFEWFRFGFHVGVKIDAADAMLIKMGVEIEGVSRKIPSKRRQRKLRNASLDGRLGRTLNALVAYGREIKKESEVAKMLDIGPADT